MEEELGGAGRCFENRWVPYGTGDQDLLLPPRLTGDWRVVCHGPAAHRNVSPMEVELLLGADLFAKEWVGNTMGFESSDFRYPI